MPRLIAFLRAINVGGHTVKMDELRRLFEALGLKGVETFIASGNVIFTTPARDIDAMQRRIENHLGASLGYEVKTFLRTDAEMAVIAQYKPFTGSQRRTAGALCVGFLAEPLGTGGKKSLMALRTDIDDFHVTGREIWWLCKKGQSESTFSNNVFEKALKCRATFRGVRTVQKLAEKYAFTAAGD
jgi:uncharacterized protein (DUF1697 family)